MGGKRTTPNHNAGVLGGRRNNHGKPGKLPDDDGHAPRFVEPKPRPRGPPAPRGPSLHPIVFFSPGKLRFARDLRAVATAIGANVDPQADQKTLATAVTKRLAADGGLLEAATSAIEEQC